MTIGTVRNALLSTARLTAGAVQFWKDGRTPDSAYQSMIRLFCATGGASNDAMSRMISLRYPVRPLADTHGVLGNLTAADVQRITDEIEEMGYHVFDRVVPPNVCDELLEFATSNACLLRTGGTLQEVPRYTRGRPEAVRYDFREQDVINDPVVQGFMADRSLIAIAQRYLRCEPIVDVTSMWWNTDFSKVPDADAAQYWHFDMDRIKWLKYFIYLTDVNPENGPHSFIEGSHRAGGIPGKLLSKGYSRLSDEEVQENYSSSRVIEFVAPRGTIIAEDTRGLHKGKHVAAGDRLMLQLQFSNSLFGGTYPPARFTKVQNNALAMMVSSHPRLYENYTK